MIQENLDFLTYMRNPGGFEAMLNRVLTSARLQVPDNKIWSFYVAQHSKTVASLTNVTFFNDTTDSNQQDVARPQGEHFIITAIKALEGNNATVNATAWVEGLTGSADIANGQIDVVINGTTVIKDLPLTQFVEADEDAEAGVLKLKWPIIWPGQQILNINATFDTAPAASDNVRFELIGFGLV